MVTVGLGLLLLAALLWGARAFSRASVASIKALLAWVLALGGLSLTALLFLTGRGGAAVSGLLLAGPLIWRTWKDHAGDPRVHPRTVRTQAMSRDEALEVLGLRDPVTEADVRAAWLRLMRAAHPDSGGSDWLAARVNQAKDVLLGRR